MRKLLFAATLFVLSCSVATADQFMCQITKVDGDKITVSKRKKGAKKAETVVLTCTKSVKITSAKIKFNREEKKIELTVGGALEGGFKNKLFSTLATQKGKRRRGLFAQVTTNEAGQVTQISVAEPRKRKKKDSI